MISKIIKIFTGKWWLYQIRCASASTMWNEKIKEKYCVTEIIGVQTTTNDLIKLLKEIEEW